MDKIDLFKSLMNKEFWNANRHLLSAEMFPDMLQDLFESLELCHKNSIEDVSCRDLYSTHLAVNPTLTGSNKAIIVDVLKAVNELSSLNQDAAKFVLSRALVEFKATCIAKTALEIAHGKHEDWDKLSDILKQDTAKVDFELVSTDIAEISAEIEQGKYRYNIPELDRALGAIEQSTLTVLAGPVNSGKSALAMSFVAAPKGFLDQGARVLHIGNEESYRKSMSRYFSCYTGMTKDEIATKREVAQGIWNKVRGNLMMLQGYGMPFSKLNRVIDELRPDVVILDMLDKIGVDRTFAREDQRLGFIYEQARESAKRYDTCVFGLSQTDAQSFGKLYYSFNRLHGSKVEKGANADTVITIGAQSGDFNSDADNNLRALNIAKSKNEGNGRKVMCTINPILSRFNP